MALVRRKLPLKWAKQMPRRRSSGLPFAAEEPVQGLKPSLRGIKKPEQSPGL